MPEAQLRFWPLLWIYASNLVLVMLTLGLYLVISTATLEMFGPLAMDFRFPVSGAIRMGPIYAPKENLVVLAVCLAAIAALWLILFRTDLGRALRALADDRAVAMAQGLRWLRVCGAPMRWAKTAWPVGWAIVSSPTGDLKKANGKWCGIPKSKAMRFVALRLLQGWVSIPRPTWWVVAWVCP